ncbi:MULTISPECIES: bifunctional diguanylate cyclase/phosphodiesterase [unclassified Roseateles]|uniref:putative bifunctional diguanylate cyclase/phosphodiesterase n=1 Tax=unclassified Roseateles TaxID=2626991 RepID=UPI0006FFB252|nr:MULTISPECIES: GGDEF domain-containing phosphodiesterase [unclassified Roseateles]
MVLHSGTPDSGAYEQGADLSVQAPPSTTLPPGPRRIHAPRGWRSLRRVGLAALSGLGGGLIGAWALATDMLPPILRLPQPAGAVPAQDLLIPLLLAALSLLLLWRLSAWALPLFMAGWLLGASLPLFLTPTPDSAAALDLLTSAPVLAVLALPLLATVLNRTLLRRLGLTGRLTGWREVGLFGLLAGVGAPLLSGLLTLGALLAAGVSLPGAVTGALELAAACALGLVSAGTALQASSQRPRRGNRWLARGLAVAAVAAQAGLTWLPDVNALLLLPHLLLCLHALQASPRANASLGIGLLVLWAVCAPPTPTAYAIGAALAFGPLFIVALSQQQLRDRDGWRSALDAQGLALAEWRLPEGRRHASARWLALTTPVDGSTSGSAPLDWLHLAHPRDREPVRRALRELLADRHRNHLGLSLRLAADGGDWRWHELQAHIPLRDRQGRARGLIATLADVSWRHTAEERERMSATLFQQASEGLAIVDMQWRIVEVNPAYCDILHAPREALVGRLATPLSAANLQRSGHGLSALQAELGAGRSWSGQLQAELDDGGSHVFAAKLSPVPEPDGVSARWRVLSLIDLGESLRQQDLLRRRLRYDLATGLPNRDEFMRLLQLALVAANRDGFKLVVGVIDLDDFGPVNAEHGQLVADAVLLQLSGRLQATLRGSRGAAPDTADQLARLHGDEFAVLMRVQSPEEAQRGAERLLAVLSTPVAVRESRVGNGMALEIGASMGATLYPHDDADPETLLRHAGHALYRAKHAGRGRIQFHDPTLDQRDEAGLIALARLQRALDSNELLLHYQPQIDLRTGQVMGVEALLRWQHPDRGLLAPAHFLPLIETTGLAVQIGDWVIEQALAQTAAWARAGVNGGKGLQVSVNVGARQLSRHDFPQRLQELIQRQPPEAAALLHLDVLEADALTETAATQALIQRCLGLGIGIALDDFGAGYSRLASLKRLSVDTLKLDRSYVQGMLGDAQDLSLVESVIGLARNIGCGVLAKGVESRAHARELLRLGCRLGQGNGIAAAMHPTALGGWMESFARSDWVGHLKIPSQVNP